MADKKPNKNKISFVFVFICAVFVGQCKEMCRSTDVLFAAKLNSLNWKAEDAFMCLWSYGRSDNKEWIQTQRSPCPDPKTVLWSANLEPVSVTKVAICKSQNRRTKTGFPRRWCYSIFLLLHIYEVLVDFQPESHLVCERTRGSKSNSTSVWEDT